MNAFSLINERSTLDLGKADFLAADQVARRAQRDPFAELAAKINAELLRDPRAGMTPAQRKRDFAESQIRNAKATIQNLRESVDFTARTWGWSRFDAHMAHRQHTLAALKLAARYRANAAEAFAEARKLGVC